MSTSQTAALGTDVNQTISLLTTTTGLIDIHVIDAKDQPAWIVPQNLVLDVVPTPANTQVLHWNEQTLPVLSLLGASGVATQTVVAVVLEGETDQHRVAVLTSQPPASQRIRISGLHDADSKTSAPYCFQLVKLEGIDYQVPALDGLAAALTGAA
ncbi:MAG: hypothetical protein RL180_1304 [Pseudomonadota bacterium]|jgi:hypothetical protein